MVCTKMCKKFNPAPPATSGRRGTGRWGGRRKMSDRQKRFLHVGFSRPARVDVEQFSPVFDKASSWIRYATNCWILYTAISPEEWTARIRKIPGMEKRNVFVAEFHYDHASGNLPEWAWEWLAQHKS